MLYPKNTTIFGLNPVRKSALERLGESGKQAGNFHPSVFIKS